MTYAFFNQKFDYGVNEVLSWFGINLIASFQDITQNMFCILAKISHLADLKICYFMMERAILMTRKVSIAQYVARNSVIRRLPHQRGISQDIQCQPKVDLGYKCYLRNRWPHCTKIWCANLLHTCTTN